MINVSRLKPYHDGSAEFPARPPAHERPPPDAVDSNGQANWTVDRIVAQRGTGKNQRYLVHWKGYPVEDATWETQANVAGAPKCVREFHRRQLHGAEEDDADLAPLLLATASVRGVTTGCSSRHTQPASDDDK